MKRNLKTDATDMARELLQGMKENGTQAHGSVEPKKTTVKTKETATSPLPVTAPAPMPPSAPELVQVDDWLAAIEAAADGKTVMEDITKANRALSGEKSVGVFVTAVEEADMLAS